MTELKRQNILLLRNQTRSKHHLLLCTVSSVPGPNTVLYPPWPVTLTYTAQQKPVRTTDWDWDQFDSNKRWKITVFSRTGPSTLILTFKTTFCVKDQILFTDLSTRRASCRRRTSVCFHFHTHQHTHTHTHTHTLKRLCRRSVLTRTGANVIQSYEWK